jgi:hypothetical protein
MYRVEFILLHTRLTQSGDADRPTRIEHMGLVLICGSNGTHVQEFKGLWGRQRRCISLGDLVPRIHWSRKRYELCENEVPVAERGADTVVVETGTWR